MFGKSMWENDNYITDDAADSEMIEKDKSADRGNAVVVRFVLDFGLGAFYFMSWLSGLPITIGAVLIRGTTISRLS